MFMVVGVEHMPFWGVLHDWYFLIFFPECGDAGLSECDSGYLGVKFHDSNIFHFGIHL
jgi:hypothetical protein